MPRHINFNIIFTFLLLVALFYLVMTDSYAKNINPGDEQYLVAVEVMPTPIGGPEAIMKKINYLPMAKKAGIEGKVYVLVYINENGDVDDIKVIKGIGGGCDEEAINGIRKEKFNPGKEKGVAVKTKLSLAINFRIG